MSFLHVLLALVITFTHLHDFAIDNFQYIAPQRKAQACHCKEAVVLAQDRKDQSELCFFDQGTEYLYQTSFKGLNFFESDRIRNSQNGIGRDIPMGLCMWKAQQEDCNDMCDLLAALDMRTKHDVTPKQKTYGGSNQWEDWSTWETWADADRSARQQSQSPRARQNRQGSYSPRGRKGKGKNKGKGKSKMEYSNSPFGAGKGGSAPLPPWPVWNAPEVSASPFQSAQASKTSTMQEMAVHLRHAYKDSEPPSDVQAFLEKADKESSRNNIKSLQAATKSLDHAQKALRDAIAAKKEHRLQWTKHVGEGIKIWETQLESFRVHQAALSENATRARAEIESSRRILKEVSENTVREGGLSIPQPIQEESEDASQDNVADPEEQKLRDQLQGVLNACAGSLGITVDSADSKVHDVSDEETDKIPASKRPRSIEPVQKGSTKQ